MPLSEFTKKMVETKLTEYCERRIPIDIRDQVNLTFKIIRDKVTLIETRPYFKDPSIWTENPVAQFRRKDDQNSLVNFRWGLIPSWAKDPSIGNKMFNARAETISEKPSFREAFKKRRCLIVADGFYEWQKIGRIKKPLRFSLKSGEPFGLAGLYETWISPEQKPVNTCTIITTEPNDLLRPIHNRMPVIVPKKQEAAWIDPDNHNQKGLLSILKPYPALDMDMSNVTVLGYDRPQLTI